MSNDKRIRDFIIRDWLSSNAATEVFISMDEDDSLPLYYQIAKESLYAKMIIDYSKPFGPNHFDSKKKWTLKIKCFKSFDEDVHKDILSLRNKVIAHTDLNSAFIEIKEYSEDEISEMVGQLKKYKKFDAKIFIDEYRSYPEINNKLFTNCELQWPDPRLVEKISSHLGGLIFQLTLTEDLKNSGVFSIEESES